ncbi:bifunctional oligoribonuclease/PAP phosphatase NrnA [Mollicutes bacterium LVI A0039]|nr:bifunctional oligoribonuclease/PAP phosphatase NrnA [Mollicutes bacterium LVI A0039]
MEKILNKIYSEINSHKKIIIHRHKRPDLDSIGSQMALYEYIKLNFPNKEVYAGTQDNYSGYEYIGEHTLINQNMYHNALVLVVDTANVERVDAKLDLKEMNVIKIDHHPNETPFGNVMYVEETRSSTCEVLFYMFKHWNEVNGFKLSREICFPLFCGIYGDTGGFKFQNTKSDTFAALSEIMKYDIPFEETVLRLQAYDEDIVRLVGYTYQNITIEDGVGYIIFDKQFQEEFNTTPAKLSNVVNFLGTFANIRAWVVFNEYDNFIRVNLRSKGMLDISQIAMQYGGGGHKNASGAMIYEWHETKDVVDKLKKLVSEE